MTDKATAEAIRRAIRDMKAHERSRSMADIEAGAKALREKFMKVTAPAMSRLTAFADKRASYEEANGRSYQPTATEARDREAARKELRTLDSQHGHALGEWMREQQAAAELARTVHPDAGGAAYEQRRSADLAEASALAQVFVSRMGPTADRRRVATEAAEVFGGEARRLIELGDVHGAEVQWRASMLAGAEDAGLMADVAAAKDRTEPHRVAALANLAVARKAYAGAVVEQSEIQRLAALAAGDLPSAARASIAAKVAKYRSDPDGYRETVVLGTDAEN